MVRRDEPDSVHQMRVATRRLRSTLRPSARDRAADRPSGRGAQVARRDAGRGARRRGARRHLRAGLRRSRWSSSSGRFRPGSRFTSRRYGPPPDRGGGRVGLATLFLAAGRAGQLIAEPRSGPRAAEASRRRAAPRRYAGPTGRRPSGWAGPARRARGAPGRGPAPGAQGGQAGPLRGRGGGPGHRPEGGAVHPEMKRLQSVHGAHQDTVIARQAERQLGIEAHLAGENAFTYGLLYEREVRPPRGCGPGQPGVEERVPPPLPELDALAGGGRGRPRSRPTGTREACGTAAGVRGGGQLYDRVRGRTRTRRSMT